jgi:hypothetical protein
MDASDELYLTLVPCIYLKVALSIRGKAKYVDP